MENYEVFLNSPINPELKTVPGIDETIKDALIFAGISTTYQLIGKFLMLDRDPQKFYKFLTQFLLSRNLNMIIKAISGKVVLMFDSV